MVYPHPDIKVSVVMPVYNAGKYLSDAMDSILSQTYFNFEFLIIDDGSTDNSVDIINSYNDNRIRLVRNENNFGIVATLNKGIFLAKGIYIARMDADDISLENRFEKQVAYLDNNGDVAVLGTNLTYINPDGSHATRQPASFPTGTGFLSWKIYWRCVLQHPTVMMRKDVVIGLGGYRDIRHAEDYDLWLRAARWHKIDNLPEKLLRYRLHPESLSSKNKVEQIQNTADIVSVHLKELVNNEIQKDDIVNYIAPSISERNFNPKHILRLMISSLKVISSQGKVSRTDSFRMKYDVLFKNKLLNWGKWPLSSTRLFLCAIAMIAFSDGSE